MYGESTQDTLVFPLGCQVIISSHMTKCSHIQVMYVKFCYFVYMFLFSFVGFFESYPLTVRSYTFIQYGSYTCHLSVYAINIYVYIHTYCTKSRINPRSLGKDASLQTGNSINLCTVKEDREDCSYVSMTYKCVAVFWTWLSINKWLLVIL